MRKGWGLKEDSGSIAAQMSSSILNRRNFLSLGTGMAALMAHGTSWGSDSAVKKYFRKAIKITDDISQNARAGAYANLGFIYFKEVRIIFL